MDQFQLFVQGVDGINQFLPLDQFIYSIHISLKNKYMFTEVPKAGCSLIKSVLICSELEEMELEFFDFEHIHQRSYSPLLNPTQVNNFSKFIGKKIFKFSFVRNPYTRVLSAYLDKIVRNKPQKNLILTQMGLPFGSPVAISFKNFVKQIIREPLAYMDPHWRVQYYHIMYDKIKYNFIGKFENLESDLSHVKEKIGLKAAGFLKDTFAHGTNASSLVADYYDDELQMLVYKKYHKDFVTFEYQKDLPLAKK